MDESPDAIDKRLEQFTLEPKPKKPTVKSLIFAKLDLIESALANGYSYDDIASKLVEPTDTDAGIHITVSTLRKYVYLARRIHNNDTTKDQNYRNFGN